MSKPRKRYNQTIISREDKMDEKNVDEKTKPHIVGVNHIALEVGNIDEALAISTGGFLPSNCGAAEPTPLLSTWAISSSR